MFSGLRSRCTIRSRWAAASATAIFFGDLESLRGFQLAAGEKIFQGLSVDVFKNQEICPIAFHQVVNLANRRMLEARENAGFPQETRFHFRIETLLGADRFHGHPAVEPGVVTSINLPHPPGAQLRFEPDVPHLGSD